MQTPSMATVNRAIGRELFRTTRSYNERDAILYALGIGAGVDPLSPNELKFVYEGSADFQVLPSFAVNFASDLFDFALRGEMAGIHYDPSRLVHGEIALELHKPLPRSASVASRTRIADIFDKGSGMLMVLAIESRDEAGDLLATSRSSMFIRGLGGFGGGRGANAAFALPERPPDEICAEATSPRQALLYRLTGDRNPLHVDPGVAALATYPRPILHGLCTFGFASRAILKRYCANQAGRLLGMEARCSQHVFPGETLISEMWRVDKAEIRFQTRVKERDQVVLSRGRARIRA